MSLQSVIIPIFVLGIFLYGLHKKVDIFSVFVKGAKENILVGVDILPSLVMLMLAVGMFRASGAMDAFSELISPLTDFLGFPSECVPLALMRPVSGSGALSILEGILESHGPDSFIGRVASVLLGSTETTFTPLRYTSVRRRSARPAMRCRLRLRGILRRFCCRRWR